MQTIGLVGLGLLGRGIAACLLAHNFRVIALTAGEPHTFARARQYIQEAIDELIARAGFPADLSSNWTHRFIEASSLQQFAPCDFVIESVYEDTSTKDAVFDQLEQIIGSAIPIASNTSALPIARLQQNREHPERLLGMHFAGPAYCTIFLEIVRGPLTSDATTQAAIVLGRQLGKQPCVLNKDVPGFIANRIAYAMYREALNLLELGIADAETIDLACLNSLPLWTSMCGPFRWIDITGGPALYAKAMSGVLPDLSNSSELPNMLKKLSDEDACGTVNGRGFFTYQPGDDQIWDRRAREHAWTVNAASSEPATEVVPGVGLEPTLRLREKGF